MTKIPVEVVPYRAEWPRLFESERAILSSALGTDGVRIEHVGSTSVPGLGAKPIIDIIVGLPSLATVEARIDQLRLHQYEYVPEYEALLPERRYFRKPFTQPRTHHLHCVVFDSAFWREHLAFRDYLRAHPDAAAAYAALKHELAARFPANRAAYLAGKSDFIRGVTARALQASIS